MSDELKPCPICGKVMKIGGESMIAPDHRRDWYRAICVSCGWATKLCDTYGEVIYAANTRPIEDAQAAEIERLRAVLDEIIAYPVYDGTDNFNPITAAQEIARAAVWER